MSELKPCPFCEGAATLRAQDAYTRKAWFVTCTQCHCSTMIQITGLAMQYRGEKNVIFTETMAKNAAIAAWNRRPSTAREVNPAHLEHMEGQPVYVVIFDESAFADPADAIDGWGLVQKSWVRVWDNTSPVLVHIDHDFEDYGNTWRAYTAPPKEG